jgi:hypothetical protein
MSGIILIDFILLVKIERWVIGLLHVTELRTDFKKVSVHGLYVHEALLS